MDDNLRYKTVQYNATSIVRQIADHRLIIYPDFKDEKRWSAIRKSQYIESIILGMPAQPIWCEESQSGDFLVIDGSQRVQAINEFIHNEFHLTGLRIKREYNNSLLLDLPYHEVLNIEDRFQVPFIVINYDTNSNLKAEFYWRLLESDRPYKSQAARNFAYREGLSFLNELGEILDPYIKFSPDKFPGSKRELFKSKVNEVYLFLLLFISLPAYQKYVPTHFTVEDLLDALMERLANADAERENWSYKLFELIQTIAEPFNGSINVTLRQITVEPGVFGLSSLFDEFLFCLNRKNRRKSTQFNQKILPNWSAERLYTYIRKIQDD